MKRPLLLLPLMLLAQFATAEAPRVTLPIYTSAAEVEAACSSGLENAQKAIATLASQPLDQVSAAGTLALWDRLNIVLEDFSSPIGFAKSVSPIKAVRDAAEACDLKVSELENGLFQNAAIYERIRRIQGASGPDAALQKELLEGFEDAGVSLPEDKRQRAKAILDRLDALAIAYQRNTREKRGKITFTPAEMEGLPASYLTRHKPDAAGNYVLGMDYPDYFPFMENAVSAEARRRYLLAFNQNGGEENLKLMHETMQLRKEYAALFGRASYAEHVLKRRMAGSPEKVLAFLAEVKQKVGEIELRDLQVLKEAKATLLGRPVAEVKLERWDVMFYSERVRRSRYAVDQEALRRYFPPEAALAWCIDLAERMYGVRFVAAEVPKWHDEVRFYDILDARGQRIAGAYVDLYPREGKYNHAAVWGVRHGSTLQERTPISALVTNFDKKGLDYNELRTLLHEFGHLLHGTLSKTRYAALSGTHVRRDFVEAPSQMFEEWTRNAETLALFKHHCKDCPIVDAKLLARLDQARLFGAGMRYARQHMLASFDMQLAGPDPQDPMQTWKALETASPLGHVEGTIFPAQFGHLMGGYAAGYYGYMWSEVLALDMASQWKGKLLDKKVSQRYLDTILSRGGEVPPEQMVREFLGREPSPEPFFAEITGKRTK